MSEPVIPELPEELIEFAQTVEIDDEHPTYQSQIEAVLRAALAWRDESGPYLYTRDQLEQVGCGYDHRTEAGWFYSRTPVAHVLESRRVAVYRLRENPPSSDAVD